MSGCAPSPSRARRRGAVVALAALWLGAACLPVAPVPRFSPLLSGSAATDGLHPLENVDFQAAWARPSARFAEYDGVWVRYAALNYLRWPSEPAWRGRPGRGNYVLTPSVFARFEEMVREIFDDELARGGLRRVEAPGAGIMEVQVWVGDLVIEEPLSSTFGSDTALAASLGALSLEVAVLDSTSGQLLARIAERRRIQPETRRPIGVSAGDALAETRRIYGSWAWRLRGLLEVLTRVDTPAWARR